MPEDQGQATEQPSTHELAAGLIDQWTAPEKPEEAQEAPEQQEAAQEAPAEAQDEAPAEPTEAEQAEIRRHKLKIKAEGGVDEEVEVDDNELKSGYMRTKDYTRKTQELAKERQAITEKVKAEVEPVVKQYQERLKVAERVLYHTLMPELQGTDWNALAQNDPAQWAAKQQKLQNLQSTLQGVQQELGRIEAAARQEQEAKRNHEIQTAVEVLQRDIPGWGAETYSKALGAAVELGMSDKQAKEITDPSVVKALHFASKYLELQKAKPIAAKKVEQAPKVLKPGSAEKPDPKTEKLRETVSRVRKSEGRDQDALQEWARAFVS